VVQQVVILLEGACLSGCCSMLRGQLLYLDPTAASYILQRGQQTVECWGLACGRHQRLLQWCQGSRAQSGG
jgi:hypothetical protein